ncbi:P-loop containing nucleoside triphosphate hydrolase protein [Violaceomyces palustris]|uniref:P-loop containing nucleoside triphosphate hydrolase protein n=1 Tax=Violaceomyces palustris TaxID=1673888 RepID=A0ACD0P8T0_9BASI|nr:P-loop containing nucleoside triphosphate hydrolase protein [Violaceomyces palustris]
MSGDQSRYPRYGGGAGGSLGGGAFGPGKQQYAYGTGYAQGGTSAGMPVTGSGSSWGRGSTTSVPNKRGRGGKISSSNRRPTAPSRVLPLQPAPQHSVAYIMQVYAHVISSGRIKPNILENPKNPLQNYVLARTGEYPSYKSEEGQIEGRRDKNFRCTLVLDKELDLTSYGDGRTAKEAEKAAALHGVMILADRDLLNKPPPPSAAAIAQGAATPGADQSAAKLSDGSILTPERAREFMDFYCKRFNFGKPDIALVPGTVQRGKRTITQGWSASMTVGGRMIGMASGQNKKIAQTNCYVDTVQYLETFDPELWKLFDSTHKPGAPISKAPHVYFNMSEEIDDEVRSIYEQTRASKIFAKRPRTAGVLQAGEAPEEHAPQPQKFIRFGEGRRVSEEFLQEKSDQLMQQLQDYQVDERVKALREQRNSLPVYQKRGDVLVKIELHQVTICMAATGSGKTTQIPQILFDDYILQGQGAKCNIVCTQPRRIAAISVAERVAKERGERLGQSVGYQVRFENKLPQPHGSITFCTTGVFLRRLQSALGDADQSNGFLDTITHVVIDEVHERDVETDLLLVVIKRLLAERRRLGKKEIKVILMSATIDPTLFQSYFADERGRPAPVVEVPGRSFPVEKHYLEETMHHIDALRLTPAQGGWVFGEKNVKDYLDREINQGGGMLARRPADGSNGDSLADAVDDLELPYPLIALMVAYVLSTSDSGHVLVFLPGWEEIKAVHQILQDPRQFPLLGLNFVDGDKFEIHILHSTIPVQDQQAVFEPPRHDRIRRIILATNIAETSITIPDVVYVVDTGRVKEKRFDPERHLSSLVSAWVGTSNLNQRAGRAGRHRSGEYYGVLSKARYDRLSVHQTVEMKRVDLSNVVMHIKALDIPGMEVEDVLEAAIEPPAPERVVAAMDKLRMVGALDINKKLTSLGRVLLQLPLDAPIGKMCLYGAFFRCLDPVLTLAAILTNRDPFMAPVHLKREADAVKDYWCPPDFRSDALGTLRAFNRWWELQGRGDFVAANRFCSDNFLSKPTLLQIQQVKEHLFQSMEKADIIQVIQGSSATQRGVAARDNNGVPLGPAPRYRLRARETDPEFNVNSDSTPLLAALVAVASAPNFALRSSEKTYRTSQDKTCFIHPSSVCHLKHTKNKEHDTQPGERELFAFGEKIRNTSMQTSGSSGNAMTMLRSCTRLDPLTYMLFGAFDVRVTNSGVECDAWLPITGNLEALDDIERLKAIMDVVMLRVFEGIGKRPRRQNQSGGASYRSQQQVSSWDEVNQAADEGGEDPEAYGDRTDLSLSPQEIEEFERLTTRVVKVLDAYAQDRASSASRGSTRPTTPAGSGYTTPSFGAGGGGYGSGASAGPGSAYGPTQGHGSNGGVLGQGPFGTGPYSGPNSNAGSRWNSRPQTPSGAGWKR